MSPLLYLPSFTKSFPTSHTSSTTVAAHTVLRINRKQLITSRTTLLCSVTMQALLYLVEEHNFLKGAITKYWCGIASFPSNNMNEPQPKLDWPRGLESTLNQGYTVHIHGESFLSGKEALFGFGRKMQIRFCRWALIKARVSLKLGHFEHI